MASNSSPNAINTRARSNLACLRWPSPACCIPPLLLTIFRFIYPLKPIGNRFFSALSVGGVAFAFTGFQNGLMLAGEVKNPQRNIPIAILGAVAIGFVLYFMLQLAFIAAVPRSSLAQGWQHLSFAGDSGPLVGLTLLLGLTTVGALL